MPYKEIKLLPLDLDFNIEQHDVPCDYRWQFGLYFKFLRLSRNTCIAKKNYKTTNWLPGVGAGTPVCITI